MTLGSHQTTIGASQTYITPKAIIDELGPFDLDPCAADPRPWDCARINYTALGLQSPWFGFVWLNPPFDRRGVHEWVEKLAEHGNGIALLHARTETEWFQPIWRQASGLLFLADRLHFYRQDGTRYEANSGAPPVLISFGGEGRHRLHLCTMPGAFINTWNWREP